MIYIGSAIWRYYDVRAAHSLNAAIAMRETPERVYWETLDGDGLISRARSQLASKFVVSPELRDADVMIILDDDVQFAPADLWRIVALAREKQAPAGGIYVTREREPHMASLRWPEQEITFGPGQKPVTIRYLATGFMAIPRCVVEDVLNHPGFDTIHGKEKIVWAELGCGPIPFFDFFRPFCIQEETGQVHYLSEDWAFCERARQCGYEIWADPSIILQHRAYVSITVYDLPELRRELKPMLSADGATSRGRSVLVVGEDRHDGAQQEELVSTST